MLRYQVLDIFFLLFHLGIVTFNLFGWIFRTTRKANLILLLLTAFSWFGLGIFYGIGFCPLTEWHWQVLNKLGSRPVENSYIQYLLKRVFGILLPSAMVDITTFISFTLAMATSLAVNIRDFKKKKIRD
ncbi:MAG: DUF2784 domain-containing protein [Bacteroidetes bacterium]|nr:DUF2784 domain-containing protein [Bacteroidota bacterium]